MPPEMTLDQKIDDLASRYSRVERAILGDPTVGHVGLVTRVEALELHDRGMVDIHSDIDGRRSEGDRRLHERVDVLTADWSKWKYTMAGISLGVGVGGGFGGTWLFNLIVGG